MLLLAAAALLQAGCKHTKEIAAVKNIAADSVIAALRNNALSYEWFSAKARVSYEDQSTSKSFTASIRMRRDSILWISVTTLMGVEAARLLIRSDSVFFLDKLNKQYRAEPLSLLEEYFPFPLSIGLMQQIIAGTSMSGMEENFTLRREKNEYVLYSENSCCRHTLCIHPADLTISTEYLVDRQTDRKLSLVFNEYKNEEGRLFSYTRSIGLSAGGNYSLSMKFSKVKWDGPLQFPFRAGDRYE
jgi:outer membrane biogenesis lipoprotein LolB